MNAIYAIDYQTPRYNKGLTRNDVSDLLIDKGIEIGIESLGCYERGVRDPSPAIVKELAGIYEEPFMTQRYCKYNCAIGQAYSYEILDSIDLSLSNVCLKLLEEHRESQEVLEETIMMIANKRTIEDFTDKEIGKLKFNIHELLDVEHTIEIFKIALNKFFDMEDMIQEHNQKCIDHGYAKGR